MKILNKQNNCHNLFYKKENNNSAKTNKKLVNKSFVSFCGTGLRKIYPPINPFETINLPVSKLHTLHIRRYGKKGGEPIVFLHGGPGLGTGENDGRWIKPWFWDGILFDQRGAGKSTPLGELKENTTKDLIEDMEKIRKHFGFEKWALFGKSWGSVLALNYASAYPERVSGMALRGVTTNPKNIIDWLFKEGGSSQFITELWEQFKNFIPKKERGNLLKAYLKRLSSSDEEIRTEAAKKYDGWSCSHLKIDSDHENFTKDVLSPINIIESSKIECYYFLNNFFMNSKSLKGLKSITNIPVEIVQGRFDMISPPQNAFEVKALMPNNPFVNVTIIEKACHSNADSKIKAAEIEAIERLEETLKIKFAKNFFSS